MLTSKRAFHGIPQNFYRLPALGTNPPSPTPSYHAPWSSNQTQPWPSQSEVATYHNKRLLCQPGVEILSCQNPSQQQCAAHQRRCRLISSPKAENASED